MADLSLSDELVRLTTELVAFPSTADRPEQIQAVVEYAAAYLAHSPALQLELSSAGGFPALVASLQPTRTPEILLNAHLDVVPARPEQFRAQLRDGRLYGRGVQDMKGAAAVLMRLMRDLAALPEPPSVALQLVGDEEIGGELGTGRLFEEGWKCRFFLAAEPTDLQICYQQKGIMWTEVSLPGRPSHGSRPWEGHNPFTALSRGLARLQQRFPTPDEEAWITTVTPTVIHGGSASNRLPERLTLTFDIRYVPEDAPQAITAALSDCFVEGEVAVIKTAVPLDTPLDDPYLRRLAEVNAAYLGQPTRFHREHFGSDARFYSAAGIPAVNFGPVGAGLHSDDEWLEIASLAQLYQILWRFLTAR